MVSKRISIIIASALILLILAGILISFTLRDKVGNDDQDQEIENSLLDDHIGSPVIIHLLFLDNVIDHGAQSVNTQQILELSRIGSEADDIVIFTICRLNNSDIPSGKEYIENGFDLNISWSWVDNPVSASIPENCRNYYDVLTEHGDQTLIFLDWDHNISYIFQMRIPGNGTEMSILSYQEIIDKIRSINCEEPSEDWLEDYIPSSEEGQLEHQWWASYPKQHSLYGSTPIHPRWLVDMLENGSILILGHSTRCIPCIEQQRSVEMIEQEYGEKIQIVDLISGVDKRTNDIMRLYDPNDSQNHIPSTILLTIIKTDNSPIQIVWHSAEGATGDDWLIRYVKDAIFYHDKYVEEWSS